MTKSEKARINIGAEGDFVDVINGSTVTTESNDLSKINNDAKKRATSVNNNRKNIVVNGVPYVIITNVLNNKDGGRSIYEVTFKQNKKRPLNNPQLTQIVDERRLPRNNIPIRSRDDIVTDKHNIVKLNDTLFLVYRIG